MHRALIEKSGTRYDPPVLARMLRGKAPAGLRLATPGGSDTALLRIAKIADQILSRR